MGAIAAICAACGTCQNKPKESATEMTSVATAVPVELTAAGSIVAKA